VAEAFAAAAEHAAQSAGGRTVYGVAGASEPELANQRQVARSIAHHCPRRLVRKKKEGVVSLFVLIGADGRAADVLVLRPAGEPELDAAAVQVVPEMRFHPSRAGGCAVPAFAEIAVTFTLDGYYFIRVVP
jgi:protein TonB